MAQHRKHHTQFKEEPTDPHHPHHSQQGPTQAQHIQQHPRPPSIVHQQQHHAHATQQPQHQHQQHQHQQHPSAYSSTHSIPPVYHQQAQGTGGQHGQDLPYYAQTSPYSTPGATSGYTSAAPDMMAATQMPRPYPPMSYHTPQSNSPASVASPSGHDQHRNMYGPPASQLQQQSLYYSTQQPQYSSLPPQAAPSPYGQHAQQSHQSMTSQPSMMMSHGGSQHQMAQHASQQHAQSAITGSPRHPKMEPGVPQQMQRPTPGPLGPSQHAQNGTAMSTPTSTSGVSPNAAPGPIPATTPLVVRQDGNGVQWIAFEYSRDRVKMEYTIRCDVETVNTDELSTEFKQENCVYPRACCPKDQYRGNRLQYETECNTVGWALAHLNAPLRGKRGLIQRAVDSWRNSNQDPRLRSRRVRRMAKLTNRKAAVNTSPPVHMPGTTGPAGMPPQGGMGPGAPGGMGKPSLANLGPQMHHHHAHPDGGPQGGGDEVGDGGYLDDHQHHHQGPTQASSASRGATGDVRHTQVFTGYAAAYPSNAPPTASMPPMHGSLGHHGHHSVIAARSHHGRGDGSSDGARGLAGKGRGGADADNSGAGADDFPGLFPDLPEAKKRKFILVEDSNRGSRLRVRVTLEGVDTREIPDSFRKGASVYPRSYFAREMQSPPPSATGAHFFTDDLSDDNTAIRAGGASNNDSGDNDNTVETEGRRSGRGHGARSRRVTMVKVPTNDGVEAEVAIPRMRKSIRGKEVRLNDMGYRMAWLQSRVFAGRTVFLQRALDCYRNKTRGAIESIMHDVKDECPHYETRVGKRRFGERIKNAEKKEDD